MSEAIEINSELSSIVFTDGHAYIYFEDGSVIQISQYHAQDCCESVYLDLDSLSFLESSFSGRKFKTLEIKKVPNQGVLFCFEIEHEDYAWMQRSIKIFCSAYNYQNGYYGTDLELTLIHGTKEVKIDISDCTENHFE